jgi:hypothetical protein
MTTEETIYDSLIRETRDLDRRAKGVQGERSLEADPPEIEELVDDYNAWYARALSVIPSELQEKFRDLYEGGVFVKRIKSFLEAPGAVSPLFTEEQDSGLIPYWQHPYETTFHSSLLEQRQMLTVAKQIAGEEVSSAAIELVMQVGRGLPDLIHALQHRHASRDPFVVEDEYDVQDLVGGVLRMIFEDVRPEDPSPTRAGGSSRVDFLLKRQAIVVEVKMTRQGMRDRELGNQLIEDIERYRAHPHCGALIALVYDPARLLRNPRGIEDDLAGNREGLIVRVVIASG